MDVSYWESLLSQLKAHLARARLRDKHKDHLRQKLELLKAEQAGGKGDSPVPGTSGGGEAVIVVEEVIEVVVEEVIEVVVMTIYKVLSYNYDTKIM